MLKKEALKNHRLVGVPTVPDKPTNADEPICPTEIFEINYIEESPELAIFLRNLS